MRTFLIQCLVLFIVMMVMVAHPVSVYNCTERTPKCKHQLLKEIKKEATELDRLNLPGMVQYQWDNICEKNFFCLAEKVVDCVINGTCLTNTNKRDLPEKFTKLKRLLHQYNNLTQETCELSKNSTCQLKKFIEKVSTCAKNAHNYTR